MKVLTSWLRDNQLIMGNFSRGGGISMLLNEESTNWLSVIFNRCSMTKFLFEEDGNQEFMRREQRVKGKGIGSQGRWNRK